MIQDPKGQVYLRTGQVYSGIVVSSRMPYHVLRCFSSLSFQLRPVLLVQCTDQEHPRALRSIPHQNNWLIGSLGLDLRGQAAPLTTGKVVDVVAMSTVHNYLDMFGRQVYWSGIAQLYRDANLQASSVQHFHVLSNISQLQIIAVHCSMGCNSARFSSFSWE